MVENATEQRVLNQEEMAQLITIAQFAKLVGVSSGIVRKHGKKGHIPGTYHVMGTIGFNPEEAKGWTPPAGTAVRSSREDGRLLYSIALLPDTELEPLRAQGFEITDPRVEAKQRRDARKAAKAAEKAVAASVDVEVDADDEVDDDDFFDGIDE